MRGTRHNTGDGIAMALDIGAQAYGHWSSCHAVAWDMNAPRLRRPARWATCSRSTRYPLGIIVNTQGERFVDEGADFRNYTYVKYGRDDHGSRSEAAFQIFDQKTVELCARSTASARSPRRRRPPSRSSRASSRSTPRASCRTVKEFNAAVEDKVPFNPAILDGKGTRGITPPKTNWAQRLDTPPYVGFGVTCGITFTFGGPARGHARPGAGHGDRPIPGLYAAGELVGGLFYHNYPGGAGLMAGAVFGKTAGDSVAADLR